MIHAKHFSHPCITCEGQVVMVRRAGAALQPVVDSEHGPHVHFLLLQLTDAAADQARARVARQGISSQFVRRFDMPVMTMHPGRP